jgi:polyadenylate-binding protein
MMYPQAGPFPGQPRGAFPPQQGVMPRRMPYGQMPPPMAPFGYSQFPGQQAPYPPRGGPMNGRNGMGGMPNMQGARLPNGAVPQGAQFGGRPGPPQGAPTGPGGRAGPPAGAGPRPGQYRGPQQKGDGAQQQQQNAQPSLTAAALANASPAEQKQILGETIYPKIHATQPELAGKITGMLLEMDNAELLVLLEDDVALDLKVQEAIGVLEAYNKKPEGAEGEAEAAAPAEETA